MTRLPSLPRGFTARASKPNDAEQMVHLTNECFEAAGDDTRITLDAVQSRFSTPGFNPATSTLVVSSPEDRLVGLMIVDDLANPPVHPSLHGCVHPEYEGKGIGTFLLAWAEERSRQTLDRVDPGTGVSMRQYVNGTHEPSNRLLQHHGWQKIRHGWIMAIDLDEQPATPSWPDRVVLRTFKEMPDLRVVFDVLCEAWHGSNPDQKWLEAEVIRWQHLIDNNPAFDPTGWFLALEGSEIAGISLCQEASTKQNTRVGEVQQLAVRQPWRRRGLGTALLQHSFNVFFERGYKRVTLGVDANNPSKATRIYEGAGMRPIQESLLYEKEIRPRKKQDS